MTELILRSRLVIIQYYILSIIIWKFALFMFIFISKYDKIGLSI